MTPTAHTPTAAGYHITRGATGRLRLAHTAPHRALPLTTPPDPIPPPLDLDPPRAPTEPRARTA